MGMFNSRLTDSSRLLADIGLGTNHRKLGSKDIADLRGQVAGIWANQAVIHFDPDGHILTANQNFLDAMGYALDEIVGKHHGIFVGENLRRSAEYKAFWQALAQGEAQIGEFKRFGRGGKEVWIHASYTPIRDEHGAVFKVVKYATEITQQKLASADHAGQVAAIRSSQAVIEFNTEGVILDANQLFCDAVGYRLGEIRGKHHRLFVDAEERESTQYRDFWRALAAGQAQAGTFRRVTSAGKDLWISASYTPIRNADGEVCKVVKYARDITEQINRNNDFQGQINGINATQAVIQFEVDGTIIAANSLFLGAMGYSLAEIQGQHHRMFVDSDTANSPAYRSFWEQLAQGQAQSDAFRRIAKGGREVWIQATYTPIRDPKGKVVKVVKYATDITAQKQTIAEITRIIGAVRQGDLSQRAAIDGTTGDNRLMRDNINQMLDTIVAPINEVANVMSGIAAKDLTRTIKGQYHGSMLQLKDNVNQALAQMRGFMEQVRETAAGVQSGADEIAAGSKDLSTRTEHQAANLEETAAAMEEMAATVTQNTNNAQQADVLARDARHKAEVGGKVVKDAVNAMGEINAASRKISDIIGVIDEIAFQTNLLALNAAVEAARAGDQGRGFAVVADEVRKLASRSAVAAKEIKELIDDSCKKVEQGSQHVTKSGTTLDEIMLSVKKVSDIVTDIMAATVEQNTGIDAINRSLQEMDAATQSNSAMVEEASASSLLLGENATTLNSMVGSFKL
jgi:methyl-accepting chemotaxis protein